MENAEIGLTWYPDVTGHPSAKFNIDDDTWIIQFYKGFGFPTGIGYYEPKNALECQFQKAGAKDKWKATGESDPVSALRVMRAVIQAIKDLKNHDAFVEYVGFKAEETEASRVKLYDLTRRLGGKKINGENFNDGYVYYIVRV